MIGDAQKPSSLATQQLPLLRKLPIPLAAIMMQQIARADRLFPVELQELKRSLQALASPHSPAIEAAVRAFAALQLSPELQHLDWATDPASFVEKMSAELWSSGQIGAFHDAAKLLVPATLPTQTSPPIKPARFVTIALDRRLSAESSTPSLFLKLRPHGTFFPNVKDEEPNTLGEWLSARAAAAPAPYAHWRLSGEADRSPSPASVVSLSYDGLKSTRQQLLARFNATRNTDGASGPEGLRHTLLQLTPEQIGLASMPDPVLRAFAMEIFTGGSGTQLYATTFVQWTVREVLRRAQPQTLLARFTPRSEATSIDLRFTYPELEPPPDGRGSLIDAEMGAYLSYLNLQRLPDEGASFLVWHEGYGQALLIGNGMPGNAQSQSPITLKALLRLTT
ncbi:hypothetical protein [Granulicella sp. dw_53]|uniref:hypothetical protein n=1 Tax=Granulicella sp. dw_53 TaxID=2719792 RepID=UPI001BD3330D|nr:hypothetical protein [Granulicella sp. dw_53]